LFYNVNMTIDIEIASYLVGVCLCSACHHDVLKLLD